MKKLLLLINISCLCVFTISCQNSQPSIQSETDISADSISNINKKMSTQDTVAVSNQTVLSGETNNLSSTKDSSQQTNPNKAIIHNAPNQNNIDSIKNAKLKGKKK